MPYPLDLATRIASLEDRVYRLEKAAASTPKQCAEAIKKALPQGPLPNGVERGLLRQDG